MRQLSAQGLKTELGHSGLIGLILVSVGGVVLAKGKGSFSISVRLTPAFTSPVWLIHRAVRPGDSLPVLSLF